MPLKQNINKHQTDTSRSADRFKVKDVYMDEADVRTTFKDKPDQRDNILNAGAAFVCPKRKVDMYAVPEYVGENEEENEHKEENIRQLEQEEKDRPPKPPKEPKPPKLPREPKPPKDNKKPLTDSQKKRLNGLKTRMETHMAKLEEKEALANGDKKVMAYVPEPVKSVAATCKADALVSQADIALALADGWCGVAKEIIEPVAKAEQERKAAMERYTFYVNEAGN